MNIRNIMIIAFAVVLAAVFGGCGADTAGQLKQTQADLAATEKQASELKAELLKAQATIDRLTQDRDQALHDVKFFANKVNPLERQNYEKDKTIAALKGELENARRTIEELKAAAEKPAPVAPATPTTAVPQ